MRMETFWEVDEQDEIVWTAIGTARNGEKIRRTAETEFQAMRDVVNAPEYEDD